MNASLELKLKKLNEILLGYMPLAVAYSGGVDSTFLLAAAGKLAKDPEKVIAVTITAPFVSVRESTEADEFAKKIHAIHLKTLTHMEEIPFFCENPSDRCYHCKKYLFSSMAALAAEYGNNKNLTYTLVDGSNVDDEGDYRPGLRAIAELGVKSPLKEAGLTKRDIRELSQTFELPTWDKPSAACLASRIPYGEVITEKKLKMIEAGETFLQSHGFSQVRVRVHGNLARIELIPEELPEMMRDEIREKTEQYFKESGFAYVTLDLRGYRTGSMNEVL